MPKWLQGVLTAVFATGMAGVMMLLLNLAADEPLETAAAFLIGAAFGLLYGLEAGILVSYPLDTFVGWLKLVADFTWSFPNTVWGFFIGHIIFIWVGSPSRAMSEGQGWIAFKPRGSGDFGNKVLQTHGTLNLGGAGCHEQMHVLQARCFGPLFLPIYAANYVVNFVIQLLWTATLGWILLAAKVRTTAWFEPSSSSVVSGFFGWIYWATLFELWAYSSGNP
jgi:hypothetical protein